MTDSEAERINFYTADYYELDNWSAHAVDRDGVLYPTAEHCYHAAKFPAAAARIAQEVRDARSPVQAKEVARAHAADVRRDWNEVRIEVMRSVLIAKARAHSDVRAALARSGRACLVENSPEDPFWGIGASGDGDNWLGRLWMEVREMLVAAGGTF